MKTNLETLEAWIDADGAWNVLLAIETVLGEKADHLRHNWQDKASARVFDRWAKKCGKLAREMEAAGI